MFPPNFRVRGAFNYDRDQASFVSGLRTPEVTRTIQSAKDDADINVIVKRFGVTGMVPVVERLPLNDDFDGVFDFQSAMNVLNAATRTFERLPAAVRKRFGHDPKEFVDFCSDPKNSDELVKMGLAIKKPIVVESPPMKVEVVSTVGKEKDNGK